MGTSCITEVYDAVSDVVVDRIYRHYDGYPRGQGQLLAELLQFVRDEDALTVDQLLIEEMSIRETRPEPQCRDQNGDVSYVYRVGVLPSRNPFLQITGSSNFLFVGTPGEFLAEMEQHATCVGWKHDGWDT